MARRSRWGSISTNRSNGSVHARYTGADGKRYRAPHPFPDEESAWDWLEDTKDLIRLGAWNPPVKQERIPEPVEIPTVGDLVDLWLNQCRQEVATGEMRLTSLQTYESIMENRVSNDTMLCSTTVDNLTPALVAGWWGRINSKYYTPDRNKRAYSKLRGVLALAVEYGYTDRNPVEIRAARRRPPVKRKTLPTSEQLHSILTHTPERHKLVTVLCLFHGLRVGEALALRRKNVAADGSSVTVEGTLQRVTVEGKTRMNWQPPKTQAGYRTVPILDEFRPLVRRYLESFPGSPGDWATRTKNGELVMDTSYRSIFGIARRKAGAPEEITPHYGRNWLITRLAEAGATPKEIGAILGQEDVSTIVNVYMRVRQQRPGDLMKKVKPED